MLKIIGVVTQQPNGSFSGETVYYIRKKISNKRMQDLIAMDVPEVVNKLGIHLSDINYVYFAPFKGSQESAYFVLTPIADSNNIRLMSDYGIFYSPGAKHEDMVFSPSVFLLKIRKKYYVRTQIITPPFRFDQFHNFIQDWADQEIRIAAWQERFVPFAECIVSDHNGVLRILPTSDTIFYLLSAQRGWDTNITDTKEKYLVPVEQILHLGEFGRSAFDDIVHSLESDEDPPASPN